MSCCGTACSHDQPCVGYSSLVHINLSSPPSRQSWSHAADEEDAVQESFKVTQVTMVTCVKTNQTLQWLPDTQVVSGMVFGHSCKWDSSLTRLVTGRGLALHKKRVSNNLNVRLWADLAEERARTTAQSKHPTVFVDFVFFFELHI